MTNFDLMRLANKLHRVRFELQSDADRIEADCYPESPEAYIKHAGDLLAEAESIITKLTR